MLREGLGKMQLLAARPRRQPHLLPDVLPRLRRHAASRPRLCAALRRSKPALLDRRRRDRARVARLPCQRLGLAAPPGPGRRRPLAGPDAGVGDQLAATPPQLRLVTADPLLRAAARPP